MEPDAKEKLLTAATRLFAEKGFAAVSIREVAQAAQANSALISYYFGGKEGLYTAVLQQQFATVETIINQIRASAASPIARLEAYAHGVLAIHTHNPYIVRFLYSEFANPTPSFATIQQEVAAIFRFILQTVNDGIACGQLRPDLTPAHAVVALAGMMNFYFLSQPLRQAFLPADRERDRQYFEDALKIFLTGVIRHDAD
ncbi:MAG: TetR family transcriptional regulator [Sporomusaceae bacterium]|nr:TetR family transcriptional regulator [Sporomusaceae bacterium]